MNFTFLNLHTSHFPLLLKWLEAPHVKAWWDPDVHWTSDSINEKYGTYVKGYKPQNGVNKPISAYIICLEEKPIGYIQIYNAYDFPRSKELSDLPESLGSIDVFIGDETYLGKNVGSQAMSKFLSLYRNRYSCIFVATDLKNIVAIKAYENAGFKKLYNQEDIGEVWLLWKPPALQVIQQLVSERYKQAQAVFWAGSESKNKGTVASDLDLVIVFDSIPNAHREAFIYNGWPIDAFINDIDTLQYFFEESRTGNGISGLIQMVLQGHEITEPSLFSEKIKKLAQDYLNKGPEKWDRKEIDKKRFLTTDILDDIKFPASREEQVASAIHLFEPLIQFYFRAQNKWSASGKSLIRYLKQEDPELALEANQSLDSLLQTGDTKKFELLVQKILKPYGGLLWDGFRSEAPQEWKISDQQENVQSLNESATITKKNI